MDSVKDMAHLNLEDLAVRRTEVYLTEQFKKLIHEAEEVINQIKPDEVELDNLNILFLDVREPEEFSSGYLRKENHLTIPRGKLEFVAIKKIYEKYGREIPIVTYCFKGPRGLLAAYQLKKMGFTNVINLREGLVAWLKCGNSLRSYFGEIVLKNN